MALKAKDTYRAVSEHGLTEETLSSLMCLYQPLIGGDGVLLYMTLFAEGRNPHAQSAHSRLVTLMNLSLDTMERARNRLEEYALVRTYLKKGESRDAYIYVLHAPMTAHDFCAAKIYASALRERVGQKQFELTISSLTANTVSRQGYEDVTHVVSRRQYRDYEPELQYTPLNPRYLFAADDSAISFDYEKFISTTSTLIFPVEFRTKENMSLIGKLGTVYGLTADKMRILVSRCVNLQDMEFDVDMLRILAAREKTEITEARDPYDLSPVSFLQGKQNGAMVSLTDKKILEHLAVDMHFSNAVINVMVEYILKISDNRLNAKFVDMVASEWARDGVETKEQALLETKKNVGGGLGRMKIEAPQYMNAKEKTAGKPAAEDLDRIRLQQEMMRKKHGKD